MLLRRGIGGLPTNSLGSPSFPNWFPSRLTQRQQRYPVGYEGSVPSIIDPRAPDKPPLIHLGVAQALDLLSKGLISLSVVSILSGLVIKNYYLLRFGIAQFEPLRSEYIATGLVWLIFSGTGVVLVWNCWRRGVLSWSQATTKKQKWYLASLLPAAILGIVYFVLFMLRVFSFNDASFWGQRALSAAATILVSALAQAWAFALFRGHPLEVLRRCAVDNPSNLVRDILAMLLFTMGLYSQFVYPHLPAMFGGADRPIARLVMRSQFDPTVLPRFAHEGNVIGPVQIVSESDDSIFVLPAKAAGRESLVRLRRDQVDAVLYEAGSFGRPL